MNDQIAHCLLITLLLTILYICIFVALMPALDLTDCFEVRILSDKLSLEAIVGFY